MIRRTIWSRRFRGRARTWRYRAFGLELASGFPLAGMRPVDDPAEPSVAIRLVGPGEIRRAWPGGVPGTQWETVFSDGCPYRGERGWGEERRFTYGERAVFLLSADRRTILCAPSDVDDMAWQRVLLDSVLMAASVLGGFEGLHASAVVAPTGALAFVTASGGGKTSLAAALVRRGYPLLCDDVLALTRIDGRVRAHSGPPLINFPLGDRERFEPGEIGTVLATFGDEAWVAVRDAASGERSMAAVYLLDRRNGAGLGLELLPATPVHLLPHALGDDMPGERVASRFELLSDLAAEATIYRLRAPLETTAARLADLVENTLPGGRESAGGRQRADGAPDLGGIMRQGADRSG